MSRQHFVDNSFIYSMQDLVDITLNVLLPEIKKKYSLFVKHIKQDCPVRDCVYVKSFCNIYFYTMLYLSFSIIAGTASK